MTNATTGVSAEQAGRRVEEVLDRLAAAGDRAAAEAAEELVRSLMDFYGSGLARIVRLLSASGGRGPGGDPLAALLGDELVASLLVLHDLHPEDRDARIARAVDSIPEHALEVAGFDEATGTLELRTTAADSGCGCAAGAGSARQAAEDALACFAPEVRAVDIRTAPAGPPLLQIGKGPKSAPTAAKTP
ncbi:hypothetical protein [Streptomyces adustus]